MAAPAEFDVIQKKTGCYEAKPVGTGERRAEQRAGIVTGI
jgi:hypothetical protein